MSIAPSLERKDSQRERDLAMARLEGSSRSSPNHSPRLNKVATSFVPQGAPPRLSALQRRHLAAQQSDFNAPEDDSAPSEAESPSYSVFSPSVVEVTSSDSSKRLEARSNLIRKLSKRDNNPSSGPEGASMSTSGRRQRYVSQETSEDHVEALSPSMTSRTSVLTEAPSEFKAYRHTYELDRDSAYAKLMMEDHFEYEGLLARKASLKAAKERDFGLSLDGNSTTKATQPSLITVDPTYQFPTPPQTGHSERSVEWDTLQMSEDTDRQGLGILSSDKVRRPPASSLPVSSTSVLPQTERHRSNSQHDNFQSSKASIAIPSNHNRNHARSASKRSFRDADGEPEVIFEKAATRHRYKDSYGGSSNEAAIDSDLSSDGEKEPLSPWLRSASVNEAPKQSILKQLSDLLDQSKSATGSSSFSRASLDAPPRKFIMHAPILQVVNANTVKDRYLFLFSDLLVIAKPVVLEDPATGLIVPPSLDSQFMAKSIVELDKLRLTAHREDDMAIEDQAQKKKQALLSSFVDRFANDPKKAINTLVTKGGLANEPAVVANLLFRTPELNRAKLGAYLCRVENKHILKAYVDRFRLSGIRIEDGVRIFLSTLRLPNDIAAAEYLLSVFALSYLYSNPHLSISPSLCTRLVITIMELNDYLHSGSLEDEHVTGNLFGFSNPAITVNDFISAFRSKDPKVQVTDEVLTRVYISVRKERIQQAADNSIMAVLPQIPVTMDPPRLPSRLTYKSMCDEVTVSIPKTDSRFQIRLLCGPEIECEPNVLSFAKQKEQSFRITGTGLGHKSILFLRMGPTASYYTGMPINKTFAIERAFMKHTFQLAFVNHLGIKRKYMFSMTDGKLRDQWLDALRQGADAAAIAHEKLKCGSKAVLVADAVALQVLRDSILIPEEMSNGLSSQPNASSRPGSRGGTSFSTKSHVRSNSFSKTYSMGIGRAETDLPSATGHRPSVVALLSGDKKPSLSVTGRLGHVKEPSMDGLLSSQSKSGHELVTLVCQNSHVPAVLGLLNAHVDAAPHPLDRAAGSAFRAPLRPTYR